jgi:hypothetical protein
MADWSRVVRCQRCREANPADVAACLHCNHQLGLRVGAHADDVRPDTPPDASAPFVARRTLTEIETALGIIRREELFSWDAPKLQPGDLTDEMVAAAERGLRLKLPAALLAVLKMQNGGYPSKRKYDPDSVELHELCGIAPGCTTLFSLQEMPECIWDLLERFLDDATYQQWRDAFQGEVHADWGIKPTIPETILLLGHEVHWGIGLNYVRCGRQGEPSAVHVEMECPDTGREILTELAPDFLTFLRMLYVDDD